jgi:cytochrome c-type biogenesis protein CcmH/NrfG
MGQIFEAQGRLPEAMLAYQEALRIQPDIDGVQSELEAVRLSLQRKVQRKAGAK